MNALALQQNPIAVRRGGQALVMSALGMVLLVLMVCMTLSFGTKAKAKMELQVVADQAAYSTSVAVARSYNMLAMTNRVMIAHMTAMLGIQSAISFTTIYYLQVSAFLLYYTLEILNQLRCCKWSCAFAGCFTALFVFLNRWLPTLRVWGQIMGQFPTADRAAMAEAQRTGMACMIMYLTGQLPTVSFQLYSAVNNQGTARKVMNRAAGGSPEWQAPGNAGDIAARETGFVVGSPLAFGVGAINQSNLILTDRHAAVASMGSRGHFFTAFRDSYFPLNGVRQILQRGYQRFNGQNDWQGQWVLLGKGYFATGLHLDILPTATTYAMADDHFVGIFRYSGPAAQRPLQLPMVDLAFLMSNTGTGIHFGIGLLSIPPIYFDGLHTVPAFCFLNCPSAWSNFVDFNVGVVGHMADNRGVPKLPVVVNRDASLAPPDPFNLMFNFRFTPSGKTFDMAHSNGAANGGGIWVRDGASMANISNQVGYSTGITYFHRGKGNNPGSSHWQEPPNLFNPYFRAGITRPDTDRGATPISVLGVPLSADNSHDIEDVMQKGNAPWAAGAYSALYNQGYQGITP